MTFWGGGFLVRRITQIKNEVYQYIGAFDQSARFVIFPTADNVFETGSVTFSVTPMSARLVTGTGVDLWARIEFHGIIQSGANKLGFNNNYKQKWTVRFENDSAQGIYIVRGNWGAEHVGVKILNNVFYVTAGDGVAQSQTEITGITVTAGNYYQIEIEFTAGVSAKVKINGAYETTHTTNLPTGVPSNCYAHALIHNVAPAWATKAMSIYTIEMCMER